MSAGVMFMTVTIMPIFLKLHIEACSIHIAQPGP